MSGEPKIAFASRTEPPGLEVRVNFGMYAGREATNAELDDLARRLLPEIGDVSVVAEQRRELTEASETSLHQVRIEIADDRLPEEPAARNALADRVVAAAEDWAQACIAERRVDVGGENG